MTSKKERVWLEEYLQCWNATEAARRAGYKWPNKIGPAKLEKFADEIAERLEDLKMSADEALVILTEQARFDPGDYIEIDTVETAKGTEVDVLRVAVEKMQEAGATQLIKSITPTRYGDKIEFYDKQTALNMILRALGAFRDRQDSFNIDLSVLTVEQLERIANGEDVVHVLATTGES